MFAEIITIGDELLIGQVVDTNSAWMGQELNNIGIEVIRRTSVRDRKQEILEAIDAAMNRVNIVLMTGGLGPTKDDITLQTLAGYFDTELMFSEEVYENVKRVLLKRVPINELNKSQAYVPKGATVIQNKVGTAPITWFDKEEKVLVSMPGVPFEMKAVMSEEILPRLKKRFAPDEHIIHKTFLIKNHPESVLAEKIADWEDALPPSIRLAYLPQLGIIRLRLTARGKDEAMLNEQMSTETSKLKAILTDDMFDENVVSPEIAVANLLMQKGLTLSTAESCTGGRVAAQLTALSGSSAFFRGSVVAYSNEVKTDALGVSTETLQAYGAVSKETVIEMVKGAMKALKTDCAVATSGIAGPTGGTPEKPVGTIWIAAAHRDKVIATKQEGDRGRVVNMERAVNTALLLLHEVAK